MDYRKTLSIAGALLSGGLILSISPALHQLNAADSPLEFSYTQPAKTVLNQDGGPWAHVDLVRTSVKKLGSFTQSYTDTAYTVGPLKLIHTYICLHNVVDGYSHCQNDNPNPTPLTSADIDFLDQQFQKVEKAGVKIILRFTYNNPKNGCQVQDHCGDDAPMPVILKDIHSLAPLVAKYKNIIYELQAGFIGFWGEGHDSSFGNDTQANIATFMAAEEAAFGPYVQLMNRLPSNIMDWEPRNHPIWGIHDDDYASGSTDSHTWAAPSWSRFPYTINTLQHFSEGRSEQLPFSAEIGCAGRSGCADMANPEGLTFAEYSQRFHLNSMNVGGKAKLLANNKDVNFSDIVNHIGPAIGLVHASLDSAPSLGASSKLTLSFINTGFSRLFVDVPVYFVMTDAGGNLLGSDIFKPIPVPIDLRQIASGGAEESVTVPIQFPVDVATHTTYYAALWMPDPDATLATMHEYNYLLNNNNVPKVSTGLNQLFPVRF